MNQDQAKEKLGQIHESPAEYTLIFSGKKSKRVNGLYRPFSKEIIIHNKNFTDENGAQNENALMFTAIHELAHHVMTAEKGKKSSRAHSHEFWATFHDLLDVAEKKGVYRSAIGADMEKLINEARDINLQIAKLQRRLGRIILAIDELSRENGLRPEDMVERKAQIDRQSANTAVAAFYMGDQGVGVTIQTEAAKQRDGERRVAILSAGRDGKSVMQAKKAEAPAKPADAEGETVSLTREKRRIEKTIESLGRRLEEIEQRLTARGGREDGPPFDGGSS